MTKKISREGVRGVTRRTSRTAATARKPIARPFPAKHLRRETAEEWRQQKRQEWKLLMNALQTFTYGCAYTPAHHDLYELSKLAERISDDLQGDWIAW